MTALDDTAIASLLEPFLPAEWPGDVTAKAELLPKLSVYLDLLLSWNGRTNLTAVREPRVMVTRHFGESLFTGFRLLEAAGGAGTLLDVGSGAGFPGLPMALLLPGWQVTLAESQGKKAAFLQEAVRTLAPKAHVWPKRVELMLGDTRYEAVTLRAVDQPELALRLARERLKPGGWLCELTSLPAVNRSDAGEAAADVAEFPMPGSEGRVLRLSQPG